MCSSFPWIYCFYNVRNGENVFSFPTNIPKPQNTFSFKGWMESNPDVTMSRDVSLYCCTQSAVVLMFFPRGGLCWASVFTMNLRENLIMAFCFRTIWRPPAKHPSSVFTISREFVLGFKMRRSERPVSWHALQILQQPIPTRLCFGGYLCSPLSSLE